MVQVVALANKKQCTCGNCKSVLEYGYGDMTFTLERDYGGGCDRVARIKCPVCGCNPNVPISF